MAADVPSTEDLDLLRAYEPVVRFNEGKLLFPAAVDEYVECRALLEHVAGGDDQVVAAEGELTLDQAS